MFGIRSLLVVLALRWPLLQRSEGLTLSRAVWRNGSEPPPPPPSNEKRLMYIKSATSSSFCRFILPGGSVGNSAEIGQSPWGRGMRWNPPPPPGPADPS